MLNKLAEHFDIIRHLDIYFVCFSNNEDAKSITVQI